jgi:hypothetical protein
MKKEDPDETVINLSSRMLPELPIKSATKIITQTEGRGLKQHTNASRGLVEAVMFAFPYIKRWGNTYVGDMVDDLMCLAISKDGQGRKDIIEALRAGGTVPDAYYSGGKPADSERDTAYVRQRYE